MKRAYIKWTPTAKKQKIVLQVNAILKEYGDQNLLPMTTRAVYYQIIAKGWADAWWDDPKKANSPKSYGLLKGIVSKGRQAGFIDWDAIEDRGREVFGVNYVESPAQAFAAARNGYALDLWHNQPIRPIVLVEKDGQLGVIGRVCNDLRVDYTSCHGYSSQSALWRLGQRFQDHIARGQRPIVFHLGDHDPSGIDMTRDNQERLSLYAGVPVQVVRLALNRAQIDEYDPPPNPAKFSDSRSAAYVAEHGRSSWELDALRPDVIAGTIRDAVLRVRDPAKWSEALAEEADDKDRMDVLIEGMGA